MNRSSSSLSSSSLSLPLSLLLKKQWIIVADQPKPKSELLKNVEDEKKPKFRKSVDKTKVRLRFGSDPAGTATDSETGCQGFKKSLFCVTDVAVSPRL